MCGSGDNNYIYFIFLLHFRAFHWLAESNSIDGVRVSVKHQTHHLCIRSTGLHLEMRKYSGVCGVLDVPIPSAASPNSKHFRLFYVHLDLFAFPREFMQYKAWEWKRIRLSKSSGRLYENIKLTLEWKHRWIWENNDERRRKANASLKQLCQQECERSIIWSFNALYSFFPSRNEKNSLSIPRQKGYWIWREER